MTFWIDAQFSPAIAIWIQTNFPIAAKTLKELGLRNAEDAEIFAAARSASAIVMPKDSDFLNLVGKYGIPPQIVWVTWGNTSNAKLKSILSATLPEALLLLASGERIVEIRDI